MNNLSFGTGGKLAVYIFDTFVVGVMAYDFYVRYRKSQQGIRRYISINWHEFHSMIPIIFFSAAQILTHDDIIVVGILLRGLGVLYLLRMSRFAKNNLRIFGGNNILHVFVIFLLHCPSRHTPSTPLNILLKTRKSTQWETLYGGRYKQCLLRLMDHLQSPLGVR